MTDKAIVKKQADAPLRSFWDRTPGKALIGIAAIGVPVGIFAGSAAGIASARAASKLKPPAPANVTVTLGNGTAVGQGTASIPQG